MKNTASISSRWSSRLSFILASSAAAVGLGNIWKFPYVMGENGGGAFVLVYLLCIAFIGIPIMMAEVVIGRRGRHSPGYAAEQVAVESERSKHWQVAGWLGMVTGFLVLSFYAVIAGWALDYVFKAGSGVFNGASAEQVGGLFEGMLASENELMLWHTLVLVGVVIVVGKGVNKGLERSVRFLLPAMFVLLVALAIYAGNIGAFGEAVAFMFEPDFSKLSINGVMIALGHSFFTLGLASGVVIMYGAYLPKETSIVQTSVWIAVIDTLVALIAGLAIFPLVFGFNLTPSEGPGLIFTTLPLAFGQMPGGQWVGTLFFTMLVIAAFTSAIAMIEASVAFVSEKFNLSRWPSTIISASVLWLLGQLTIHSFSGSSWAQLSTEWLGKPLNSIFDVIDLLTSSILLPLGGLLLAILAGWVMTRDNAKDELDTGKHMFDVWHLCLKYVAPIAIIIIFLQLIGIIEI
ncbi:NSS family neurotransmitter:Na+ symporter [Idiomarina fontislapidosi]|uniref:Transporter n=1 Tax=Idiomarina fontislapidosi TaxID=263723 RepID=A0A432Y9R9_9GAMM|nr:sodium-dependent transporter [Idiomarina fontislapidosi]PYE34329.1 NSS family neurotransmitter:Na+ symporter [Idiomarina fontislapidosi]RUO57708.1 sodium-dependent transporter [Idiomarina fontislapidosi]